MLARAGNAKGSDAESALETAGSWLAARLDTPSCPTLLVDGRGNGSEMPGNENVFIHIYYSLQKAKSYGRPKVL